MTISKEPDDKIDQEVDDLVEKLSEEDQELLDQALANLMGFIERRNKRGMQFPLIRVSFLRNKINQHEEKAFDKKWRNNFSSSRRKIYAQKT